MSQDVKFREGFVDADGFRIRCMQAGDGPPLLHLHGAHGMSLTRGLGMLTARYRVIACEMPGFGKSPENTRTQSTAELASTMAEAMRALGIGPCPVIGTSFGGKVALWLAARHPALVSTLVLEAPAAIRPDGQVPPFGSPEEMARVIYAHPERMPPLASPDPAIAAKTRAFALRVRGPDRDAALEAKMRSLDIATLVLFGTLDHAMPPEMGRHYKSLLPNCHLVFVYDSGHAISAERPEAFADVTLDFLERREAFVINRRATVLQP